MVQVKRALQEIVDPQPQGGKEEDPASIGLSRNESHFGTAPGIRDVLAQAEAELPLYPENTGAALRQALAARYGLSPEEVLLGNGSFELIALLAAVYLDSDDDSIVPEVTFGAYKKYARMAGAQVVSVPLAGGDIDLPGILDRITARTKIVWICNPNNPTGRYIGEEPLRRFLDGVPPAVLVVLDEAYIEFTDGYDPEDSVRILRDHPNVIVLRTFSKFYGLASLRIGYALGNEDIIDTLYQFRIGPNHSRIAESAALVSLADRAFQARVKAQYIAEKERLYAALGRLGIPFWHTQTNFLLFQVPGRTAAQVVQDFEAAHIRVRDAAVFGLPGWVRLSFGNEADHRKVIAVLEGILGSGRQ